MKASTSSPKRQNKPTDPLVLKERELKAAEKRIKRLEKELANRNDEIDLLKKAEQFFERKK
jgi:transposase